MPTSRASRVCSVRFVARSLSLAACVLATGLLGEARAEKPTAATAAPKPAPPATVVPPPPPGTNATPPAPTTPEAVEATTAVELGSIATAASRLRHLLREARAKGDPHVVRCVDSALSIAHTSHRRGREAADRAHAAAAAKDATSLERELRTLESRRAVARDALFEAEACAGTKTIANAKTEVRVIVDRAAVAQTSAPEPIASAEPEAKR
jgi:hypothetical protein